MQKFSRPKVNELAHSQVCPHGLGLEHFESSRKMLGRPAMEVGGTMTLSSSAFCSHESVLEFLSFFVQCEVDSPRASRLLGKDVA
jgi:hypothetical protein